MPTYTVSLESLFEKYIVIVTEGFNWKMQETATSDVMVEEISVTTEAGVVDIVVPESKIIKAAKAGAKASKETIEMWQENGFSR